MPTKILVAIRPEAEPAVEEALDGYDLLIVRSVQEAVQCFGKNDIDFFMVGILFDDSKALEFIKIIRAEQKYADTPILVVRLMPTMHEEMLRTVMETMLAAKVVKNYFEIDWQHPEFKQLIREEVERHLPAAKCVRCD